MYLITIALTTIMLAAGCASASTLPNNPLEGGTLQLKACPGWRLPLLAHISHVSISSDGTRVLVSTSAERGTEARLRLIDAGRRGKVLWTKDLKQPIKSQAIASDASRVAVSSYDGKTYVYDGKGRLLWEKEHLGKPAILPRSKRILIFNDDDSEPKVAFASYDYAGGKRVIVKLPPKSDGKGFLEPLDMDASDDERFVAVTTTDRTLLTYSPEGKLVARGKLAAGESVAIEASGDRIYTLTSNRERKGAQALSAYGPTPQGELRQLWTRDLDRRYEALRAAGDRVFLYGNTHQGQALAGHHAGDGSEAWQRSYSVAASYAALAYATNVPKPLFTVAIDTGVPAGTLHVFGIEPTGKFQWDANVEATSGLYSYAYAERGSALVVGAGEPNDGVVQLIKFQREECRK